MNIILFGASGKIGMLLVQQALANGHHVKAYVRNPSKIALKNEHLQIVQGVLSDEAAIRLQIRDADVVISVLGPPLKRKYEGTPLVDGYQHIVAAMQATGVRRLITLATPSARFEKDIRSITTTLPRLMGRLFFPKPYTETVEIGKLVQNSTLDWTIVRIIAPQDKPSDGEAKVTFGDKKIKFGIPRETIARFILKEAREGNYIHSMPIIGS